jgi:hypothetical protein
VGKVEVTKNTELQVEIELRSATSKIAETELRNETSATSKIAETELRKQNQDQD